MNDESHEWVTIFRSANERECRERALVLQAVGTPYQIRWEADGFAAIAVQPADTARGLAELDAYAKENPVWTSAAPVARQRADGWNGVLGFVAVLSLMAVMQRRDAFGVDWFSKGKTHAGLICDGEWWRTVTALTLHVDLEHVFSNLAIGGIVGLFAGQSLGSGLAWCCILVAGALGNLANAWVHPPEHTSVGASTAVFAALGLLAAHGWWLRRTRRTSRLERWVPLVGGVVLLSFLGTGGGRTDVMAHVLGFVCGIPFGAWCGRLGDGVLADRRSQLLFGLAALAVLAIAWTFALLPRG